MQQLETRMAEYAKTPFFTFLRDPEIDPRQKLAFAPHVAHFVLTFRDLYSIVLKEEPPSDEIQELVNANAREDEVHWRWFLSDLATLDLDPQVRFSDAIRLIWSPATVRSRTLSYHLCRLGLGADSIAKLVLIHCIEGAFQASATSFEPVAKTFTALTGKPLVYLGAHHSEAEASHTLEEPAVRRKVLAIELDETVADQMRAMVDECFALFTAFADEVLDLARRS
jgi:hypothetical protein